MGSYIMWLYVGSIASIILYIIVLSSGLLKHPFKTSATNKAKSNQTELDITAHPFITSATSVYKNETNSLSKQIEVDKLLDITAQTPLAQTLLAQTPSLTPPRGTTIDTENFVEDLPLEFRVCRLIDLHPPVLGELPISPKEFQNATTGGFDLLFMQYFRYQCAGDRYHQFLQEHQFPYVVKRHQTYKNWGTRPTIVPLIQKNSRSRHILVLGNSHTCQMMGSMLCQYHDQIQSSRKLSSSRNIHDMQYTLFDGALILTVMINHPIFYSYKWKENLEGMLGFALDDAKGHIDAIILGRFNPSNPEYVNATLWANIAKYGEQHPEQKIDPLRQPEAFDLLDLAEQYKGPIIWCSMLAAYNERIHEKVVGQIAEIVNNAGRTNLRSVHARHHAVAMGNVECSSNTKDTIVDTCIVKDTKANKKLYFDGHRCMGDMGGQPDLVAWDVIEALHDVLSVQENGAGGQSSNDSNKAPEQ